MKVLFLYPNIHGINMLPSALGLFCGLLKQHGHVVDLFDSTNYEISGETDVNSDKEKERLLSARPFDDTKLKSSMKDTDVFEDFRKKVKAFQPDLIAVSTGEITFLLSIRLLKKVRDLNIPTIMGGVFSTLVPEKCIEKEEIDIICVGEGENALVELCKRMEKGQSYLDIPSLWIKTENGILKNPMAPPVDINQNPLTDISLFEEAQLYRPMQGRVLRMMPVETHRGCPYKCAYCCSPEQRRLYWRETKCSHFRKKSFDAVHREMRYFKDDMKAEALYFWADTFLEYTDREFDEFCEMYEDIHLPFWCQTRPETIDDKRIKRLMRLGLFRVGLGVEHGNEEFRKKVLNRKVSNSVMIRNFRKLNKLGLHYSVNNIIGFPTETRELAMDTIMINRQIEADNANAYVFTPFQGTSLRKLCENLGYCDKDLMVRMVMKNSPLNMPQFPAEEIDGIRRCFTFYVKMPLSKWPEIEKAEKLTPEGNRIWEELREECLEKYISFD